MKSAPTSASKPSSARPAAAVDWAAIRARVERTTESLASPEIESVRRDEVLQQRARALVAPPPAQTGGPGSGENACEVLSLRIGGQVYGIDAKFVREAVRMPRITPLPGLPPTLRGLANVRSRIVPVFDLRPLLNLPASGGAARETLLLLTCEDAEFGLAVEEVLGARSQPDAAIRPCAPGMAGQYLKGVCDDGLILLDLPAIAAALAPDDRASS